MANLYNNKKIIIINLYSALCEKLQSALQNKIYSIIEMDRVLYFYTKSQASIRLGRASLLNSWPSGARNPKSKPAFLFKLKFIQQKQEKQNQQTNKQTKNPKI